MHSLPDLAISLSQLCYPVNDDDDELCSGGAETSIGTCINVTSTAHAHAGSTSFVHTAEVCNHGTNQYSSTGALQ